MNLRPGLKLEQFLREIKTSHLLEGIDESEFQQAGETLSIFKAETNVAYSLIRDSLSKDMKILEVGAGLCLLSLFLKYKGYNIVACEPLLGGFGFFDKLKTNLLNMHSDAGLEVLSKSAQNLNPDENGKYDLIFSNNVMEHIIDLEPAIIAMRSVMKKNGKMIHNCPNYFVPYEPHFGIPVFSAFPGLTKLVWRKQIDSKLDVWESLNFITYFRLKKIVRAANLNIEFRRQVTYQTFARMLDDKEFLKRHEKTIAGKVFRFLIRSGTINLVNYLPVWFNTPMIFTLSHNSKI